MDLARVVPLAVAVLCVASLGVAATTMESTLSTDPDEEIDPDWDSLPLGEDRAAEIKEQMGDADDGDGADAGEGDDGDGGGTDEAAEDAEAGAPSGEGEGEAASEGPGGERDASAGEGEAADQQAGGGDEQDSGDGTGEDDGEGTQPPGFLARLWAFIVGLLKLLLPLVVLAALVALAYYYREELLALLGLDERGGDAAGATGDDRSWPPTEPSTLVDRAWVELVERLNPERPWTLTPAECAAVAREAGLDDEAVARITGAFERVHYADVPVAEEERRAWDGLERLREESGRGGYRADGAGDRAGDSSEAVDRSDADGPDGPEGRR